MKKPWPFSAIYPFLFVYSRDFSYICISNVSYTIDKRNEFDKQNAI